MMIGWAVSVLLTPLEWFWPEGISLIRYTDVLALLIALLAALSLWVRPLPPPEPTDSERYIDGISLTPAKREAQRKVIQMMKMAVGAST
jgi:hypothetical protein